MYVLHILNVDKVLGWPKIYDDKTMSMFYIWWVLRDT